MKTKQLIIFSRKLEVKDIIIVDNIIPVEDIISPQKTTFEVQKDKNVTIGDLVVLKNNNIIEYIGVVQDLETNIVLKIYSFPLINITDTDCIMTNISGNVFDWIESVLTANFVETEDDLLNLPFTFKNSIGVVDLSLEVSDGNLFDVLLDIFKKTGVYLDFSLEFVEHKPKNILVEVKRASDSNQFIIRYDNPILFEKPVIEQSQAQSVNKIIFRPSDSNKTHKENYIFYLLDNNKVVNSGELKDDDNEKHRINGVVQQIQQYSDDDYDNLRKSAEEAMLGDVLNHQITLKVINNVSFNFKLYSRVQFIDEQVINGKNRVFETYITRIENNNDIYKVLRLGILRTTLTDKIKALQKAVLNTQTSVYTGGGTTGGTTDYTKLVNKPRLNTSNSNLLSPTIEDINGDVNLHRVSKTGSYTDLRDKPVYIVDVQMNDNTGIFTFRLSDGSNFTIDTLLEKVVTNFVYNEENKSLDLTLEDGTVQSIPIIDFMGGNLSDKIEIFVDNVRQSEWEFDGYQTDSETVIVLDCGTASTDKPKFEFEKISGGYAITEYTGSDVDVIIPDTYNNAPVLTIEANVFKNKTNMKSIVFGNNLTTIKISAFSGCTGLTSIIIPESVTMIQGSAFSGCTGLTSVEIKGSITDIYSWTFDGCSNLTSITLPNTVTAIYGWAFRSCGMETITLTSVSTIYGAFNNCKNLKSVSLPNIEYLEEGSFSNCTSLKNITLSNKLKKIGRETFKNCALTSIYIPLSCLTIGDSGYDCIYAPFWGCPQTTIINCQASGKQDGWQNYWNIYNAEENIAEDGTFGITYYRLSTNYNK